MALAALEEGTREILHHVTHAIRFLFRPCCSTNPNGNESCDRGCAHWSSPLDRDGAYEDEMIRSDGRVLWAAVMNGSPFFIMRGRRLDVNLVW